MRRNSIFGVDLSLLGSIKLINIDFFRYIHLIFKPRLLKPDKKIENLDELLDVLDTLKISAVIFDIDQTIVPYGEITVSSAVIDTLDIITKRFSCCMLSNFPSSLQANNRIEKIESQIGLKSLSSKNKKPNPKSFKLAIDFLQEKNEKIAMVGDRLFTDILGANNIGLTTILVSPINWKRDPLFMVTFPRLIERFILYFQHYRN